MEQASRSRMRTVAGSVPLVVTAIVLGFIVVPALAHDDGQESKSDHSAPSNGATTVVPTPEETPTPKPEVPGPPILSRADLERYEAELDPDGSPLSYVCANIGDTDFVVVQVRPAPPGLQPDPNAGPVQKLPDPCEGKSLVVGKE